MPGPPRLFPAGSLSHNGCVKESGPFWRGARRLCYQRTMPGSRGSWRDRIALLAALLIPLAVTAVLVPFRTRFPNTDAALVLIFAVVVVAANGYRLAGVVAAISAAIWFDFFLTRPYEHFSITRSTDIETTALILIIGVAVTEVAVWGRREHLAATRRAGYLAGINAAAEAVAVGHSPPALIDEVCARLTRLLSLRSCTFQYGVAGLGAPARMQHDGRVTAGDVNWDVDKDGLPTQADTELLVESGGILRGRFLLTPEPATRPSLEQRLVAIALADQVGAALAASQPT
jgi:K+-sensing histidine kinase KdpD